MKLSYCLVLKEIMLTENMLLLQFFPVFCGCEFYCLWNTLSYL